MLGTPSAAPIAIPSKAHLASSSLDDEEVDVVPALGASLTKSSVPLLMTPSSPAPFSSGLIPPHGTPVTPNPHLLGSSLGTSLRATRFDPYPAAPAPTPASSFVDASYMHAAAAASSAATPAAVAAALPALSSSVYERQLAFNSDPFSSATPTPTSVPLGSSFLGTTPTTPTHLMSGLVAPATTPVAPSYLAPMTAAMATLSTSPGPAPHAPTPANTPGQPSVLSAALNGSARTRRRSSLSITATMGNAASTASDLYLCDECGKVLRTATSLAAHRAEHQAQWRAQGGSNARRMPGGNVPVGTAAVVAAAAAAVANGAAGPVSGASAPASTSASTVSTLPSSPAPGDDEIMFPMHDDA
ncbi:hypothetical protein GGF32_006516 [Allomyces javanicus]|nr:hypothetical protein GGF32_006516 [Allomyces javanicus]